MKRSVHTRGLSMLLSMLLLLTSLVGLSTVGTATAAGLGDINGDGSLSTVDARTFLELILNETELTAAQKAVADVNGDGAYSTLDVREILIHVVSGTVPEEEAVRGVWLPYWEIGSLYSSGNVAKTKAAIDACFDDCVARGANTVYYHVRANSDAYYNSAYFKENGYAATLVNSGFDPFAYAVESAHTRGLKIEAWVNPYRIGADASYAATDAYFSYSGRYYYVPTDADVKQLVINGVKELVNNYDIDGVQFDDYFYPNNSVSTTAAESFETADYAAYQSGGGTLSVADWRRANVNELVKSIYNVCHSRTGCVFGISPSYDFEANYNEMYADAKTWAANAGYVDYLLPQLYTGFNHAYAPFDEAIAKWNEIPRHSSVKLYAGLALYKTGLLDDTWAGTNGRYEWVNNSDMMTRQIALAKELGWTGVAFYSHLSFTVDDTRDATVANQDMAAACEAWLTL